MSFVHRVAARRRAVAAAASLALGVGLVGGMATAAFAASSAKFLGYADGQTASVKGTIDGQDTDVRAGQFEILIDGATHATAYCVDFHHPLPRGLDEANGRGVDDLPDLPEATWSSSGVNNLPTVEKILANYHPNGVGPDGFQITGGDNLKSAATQAAIWHFTDGFDLDTAAGHNNPTIIADYQAILGAVDAGVLHGFGEPEVALSIESPNPASGHVGDLVGPYVVHTTADKVTLTPSDGIKVVDKDGKPITGDVTDGTQLFLTSDKTGDGSVSAEATSAPTAAGRVFAGKDAKGEPFQRLVLATTITTQASAVADVSFTETPPTTPPPTPPTSGATTTSTVPVTPQTSVTTPGSTTTVSVTPQQGGGLPVTGGETLMMAAVALVLIGTGTAFGIYSKRRRGES